MKQIEIGKAHSNPCAPVEGATIVIDAEVDVCDYTADWESAAREIYDAQARHLEEALYATLPGATYDRLFAQMAERKASLLKIPHGG